MAFYLGAHGGTSPKEGWATSTMDGKTLTGRELKEQAAEIPCPVLFVIDTCGSGGFTRDLGSDIPLPANCVAFCSSGARQSTTNAMNIALHEALWGMADSDNDDKVEVDEVIRYIRQRVPKISPRVETPQESEIPVLVAGEGVAEDQPLVQVSGNLSAVLHQKQWYLGRVEGEEGEKVKLHLMGCNDRPEDGFFILNEAPKRRVFELSDEVWPVMVKDEDGEGERPALRLARRGMKTLVRFVPSDEQEEVDRSRVRLPFPNREPME